MNDYPDPYLAIDGEKISASRESIPVLNPATEQIIGAVPKATHDDLDRALAAAERGFAVWRATPAETRGAVLHQAGQLLRARIEEIARIATIEQGKPLAEARLEVTMSANSLEWAAGETRRLYGRVLVRPDGRRSMVVKEPVGPIAAFAPWNFPIDNPARKFSVALGAGCSCILKPAEESPGSALAVHQALVDAGLPRGVAQVVFGAPDEISRHLIASPVIRHVSLTGSVSVGKQLMRLAADGLKRTTFELGGHAPVLVFADADVNRAATLMAVSKFRNAGQVCISPTRFYVHETLYDQFLEAFVAKARAIIVGDGLDPSTQMGPMANDRRPPMMRALVSDAVERGARLMCGGQSDRNAGFFWQPTVLADIPSDARVMNEEPFGPIAAMARFSDPDEAIAQANRLPYGLAAYAFTESAKLAMRIGQELEAGMIGVNTNEVARADSPFGGVKESGHGSEEGQEGIQACLVTKAIHQVA